MAERIRDFDWSKTPLGPPDTWSVALRTTVGLIVANRFPQLLWWGPEYISLYNDAYIPVLDRKHPQALGLPVRECWSEIWDVLRPLIDTPFDGGPSTWIEDFELYIERSGFLEETHFTVAYSPVPDTLAETGIGGVLATVHEITEKVVADRRVVILRDLAIETSEIPVEETCRAAMRVFGRNAKDVPFALLYLLDSDRKCASLAGTAGTEPAQSVSPEHISMDLESGDRTWPFASAFQAQGIVEVSDLAERFDVVPAGSWIETPELAVVVPLRANRATEPFGFLICGVSSRLKLDQQYRDFYETAASHIATAITVARAFEDERKRSEALAEIDRAKTAFFSNVSHEFRTPLTLMLGPLEDALASPALPEAERDRLDAAHRNSLRLLKLVNSLLDFSRIEAGRARAEYAPVNLGALTAELASAFTSAVEKADLRFTVTCPTTIEPAYVDRDMWEKIVLNLISNAFKFTFHGGIEVTLRDTGTEFELIVRDTGIGIAPDELPKIFERFHRVEGARGRTHEGSGIGLALVQELVRLHGGELTADSTLGEGTTFNVRIPRGNAHLPQPQVQTRAAGTSKPISTAIGTDPFVEEALRWLPGSGLDISAIKPGSADQHSSVTQPRPRILIADDNADMRDYLCRLLGDRYDLMLAEDGEAAFAAIERQMPDLALSDVMMPRLDGLGLLARLRSNPRTRTLPVILLSARAGEESNLQGLQTGADDYLTKPFTANELLARVAVNLQTARIRREAAQSLSKSEARFRALVTAGATMLYRMSPDWREMYQLDGRSVLADTERSDSTWRERYILREDRVAISAAIEEAIQSKTMFQLEHRVRLANGSVGWVSSRAVPMFGPDGKITEWFGAGTDISDRKQAEETQELLVAELNHRVKNTLANVQAIAHQMLRRATDPADFVAGFSGRIQSLSRVHTMLTETKWHGVDLRDLIRDQLFAGAVDEARVTSRGPPVLFDAQLTLHAALMLHELGTNAIKYGALSNATGVVTISWSVADGTLRLRWEERGGPAARAPAKRGFGRTLIERSAKGEGGDAQMSIEADGVVWAITLPLREQQSIESPVPQFVNSTERAITNSALTSVEVLAGKRLLVIEDEALVQLDIASALESAGATVVGSAGTARNALALIENTPADVALLDANLRGDPVGNIAAALASRNIPFLFVTGYGVESLPPSFARTPVVSKPFSAEQLVAAVVSLLQGHATVHRLRT